MKIGRIGLWMICFVWFGVWVPKTAVAQDDVSATTLPPGELPIEVYVDLYGVDVMAINEAEETFEVDGYLYAEWYDARQAFDTAVVGSDRKVYQEETAVDLLKTIWWPDFEIVDARGPREKLHLSVTVYGDGFVTYSERFQALITQPFYLGEFPFDQHEISLSVAPFYHANNEVIFIDEGSDRVDWNWETNEWYINSTESQVNNGELGQGDYAFRTLFIEIQRIPNFYLTNVIIPLLLIMGVAWAVFWMDFENMHLADRLSVSFTSVLTVVAFDFVSAGNLPQLPYQTLLDQVLSFSYVLLGLVVLENVLAYRFHQTNPGRANRIDRVSRWIFPLGYYGLVFFFLW